jgi:cyclohexyl-isocyanide hydratase
VLRAPDPWHHRAMALQIGMLLYPGLTQLDLAAPLEVMHRLPGAQVHLVWKDLAK